MVLLESISGLLGSSAHEFKLMGTDDQAYTLNNFRSKEVLVIIFMCNHCPYVKAVIDRLNKLQKEFQDRGVQLIGINANDATNYPDDSFENMKKLLLNFPYLYDETQEVAKTYKAVCTPDIFVYDKDRKLVYHGRIDDNWQDESAVTKRELAEALEKILADEEIPVENQHPSMGCSIKWR